MKNDTILFLGLLLCIVSSCSGNESSAGHDAGISTDSYQGDLNRDTDMDTGSITDADVDTDTDSDTDTDTDTDTDSDSDTDTDTDTDTDSDTDTDTDSDTDSDTDTDTDSDTDTDTDPVGGVLDIPPREQWINDHGYCGCCSIQQIALYYGTYVSQDACRKITGNEEVLLGDNEHEVLEALRLAYEQWDYHNPRPQYRDYLVWVKNHLAQGSPVIIVVYLQDSDDDDYDHIIPAIGFHSVDVTQYHDDDELVYNDCFSHESTTTTFETLWNNRRMTSNDACVDYCIPERIDWGTAVTGIRDDDAITKPVRIALSSWNEPNVTQGESAVIFDVEIAVSSLTVGASYLLLRYNDYTDVPTHNFEKENADSAIPFTAENETETFTDTVLSSSTAIYRCVLD